MENMTAFPALITLYSRKVLPSLENLPVSETSRYGEHMLLILLLFKGTPNLRGATFAEFFFLCVFPLVLPIPDYHSKICTQKLTVNVTEKLSLSREAPFLLAMIVWGSIISLAGGSQCEPCVDIILREGVICL